MDSDKNNRVRVEYLDLLKGFGMLLVIWAHIMVYGYSTNFIYSFHMPLFFFASGILFNPDRYNGFRDFVMRRVKSLLIPYVLYSVITWGIWVGYSYFLHLDVNSYWKPLLQTIIAQGSGGFLVHNVPLWFVTCLFVVEAMYFFISKLPRFANLIICVAMAVLGYCMIEVFDFFDFTVLPWSIEVAFATIIFYCIGHLMSSQIGCISKKIQTCNDKSILFLIIIEIALCIIILLNSIHVGHVSFGSDRLGTNPVLLYFDAFCGIAVMVVLSQLFQRRLKGGFLFEQRLLEYVKWIGRNSFKFMAVHVPLKGFLVVITAKITGNTTEYVGGNFLLCAIIFVITLAIVTVITFLTLRGEKYIRNAKSGR